MSDGDTERVAAGQPDDGGDESTRLGKRRAARLVVGGCMVWAIYGLGMQHEERDAGKYVIAP